MDVVRVHRREHQYLVTASSCCCINVFLSVRVHETVSVGWLFTGGMWDGSRFGHEVWYHARKTRTWPPDCTLRGRQLRDIFYTGNIACAAYSIWSNCYEWEGRVCGDQETFQRLLGEGGRDLLPSIRNHRVAGRDGRFGLGIWSEKCWTCIPEREKRRTYLHGVVSFTATTSTVFQRRKMMWWRSAISDMILSRLLEATTE